MKIRQLTCFYAILLCSCTKKLTYPDVVSNMITEAKKQSSDTGEHTGLDLNMLEGVKCPNFNLKDIDGTEFTSSSLEESITLINFWFTDCPGCITEIPNLNKLQDEFTDRVNFISITMNDSLDVTNFLSKLEWNFRHLINGSEVLEKDFKNIFGYPMNFLLNRNSEIVQICQVLDDESYARFSKKMEDLIKLDR